MGSCAIFSRGLIEYRQETSCGREIWMKTIYRAANLSEAHILRGILEESGIETIVQGESLNPLRGMLPVTLETNPSVCILNDDDEERAMKVLEEYREKTDAIVDQTPWICGGCGEEIEPQFTDCWNCGSSRSGPYR
jgi:hypothetical protein